jgi:hypothetical protein
MIEMLPESEGNTLVLRATGKLTDQDYKEVMIPYLENIIKQYGKARVVMYMDENFKGWNANAMWDDMRFGMSHRHDFERMCIVGGPKCVEWGTKLGKLMMSGEIKYYPANAYDEAVAWTKGYEPVTTN